MIDIYPVNCSFSATSNLIFVPTRIVLRSLNLGLTPSISPDTVLHTSLIFFKRHRSVSKVCLLVVGAQHQMLLTKLCVQQPFRDPNGTPGYLRVMVIEVCNHIAETENSSDKS
jgi:hypothetical protein